MLNLAHLYQMTTYLTKAIMTNKKRGRPAKQPNIAPISMGDIADTIRNMPERVRKQLMVDRTQQSVNWEEVAKKQEVELSVLRTENDELARICVLRYEANTDLRKIISYLESKLFKNEDQPV